MKLTEEQSRVVEDNHNLIFWYAHKYNFNLDEWYDLLAIALCLAVMKYNPEKGSLSNYYKLYADGMVYKECRKNMAQKNLSNNIQYIENIHDIPDQYDLQSEFEIKEYMGDEYGEIIKMRYEGYTQSEIAVKLGVSQSYISTILKKMKEDYHGVFG